MLEILLPWMLVLWTQ